MDGLAKARRALADATPDIDHDHRGPDPCPVCGGTPSEPAPKPYRRPLREESENGST